VFICEGRHCTNTRKTRERPRATNPQTTIIYTSLKKLYLFVMPISS
jgi:hypothetical protein